MEQDYKKSEKFKTVCKPCVFAEFENNLQVGCELDRLDKYIKSERAILKEDGTYEIQTICNACRGQQWLKNQPINISLLSLIEQELVMQTCFMLTSINDCTQTIHSLLPKRLSECVNQKHIKPSQIVVIIKGSEPVLSSPIYDMMHDICGDISCKLVKIVDAHSNIDRCIDIGMQHINNSRYCCISYLEHNIPLNILKILNDVVNIDLRSISMVEPLTGYSGLILQTALYKIFGGNRIIPIYEKIKEAAAAQNKSENILTWEQLWISH